MMKKTVFFVLLVSLPFLFSGCDLVDSLTGKKDDDSKNVIHPVLLNGKWGYINSKGQIAVKPAFDDARPISNGMAAVRVGTLWGYVNAATSSLAIEPMFTIAGDFGDDLAPVQLPGQPYGYINKGGDFVVEPGFDFASPFSEGLAAVRTDGLWGYIKNDGSFLLEPKYSSARAFSDGLAAVESFDGWIYINTSGSEVINPTFRIASAGEFVDGIAPIQTTEGWGFINKSGNLVITPKYSEAGRFSQGRAWIRSGNFIGFIDKDEKMIVEPQFAEVRSFSEDMAAVRLNNSWFYLSRKNNLITISQPFYNADSFRDGIARVTLGSGQNTRYGYIDKKGEYIWFPTR